MSPQDMSAANKAEAETAAPVETGQARSEDPIGAMFAGFGEFCETPMGRMALIGSKVLLFNVFLWGPIAALGYMIFFW